MRQSFALVLLLPALASAQPTAEQKKETVKWILGLQARDGGFYLAPTDPRLKVLPLPSLRATNGAVRALKYLGADVPNKEKHAAFVLKCFDPKTGGFAEAGGEPDVGTTSVGVMAAMELGVPKQKIAKAMDFLKEHAKTFEEVRIGAAAVEAWGVKDCPFKLDGWKEIAFKGVGTKLPAISNGGARMIGSLTAFAYRLNLRSDTDSPPERVAALLNLGQLADGGWSKEGAKASDIETTYRVMRAFMLMKQKPKDVKKLREFIAEHRHKDGGSATKPGDKPNMSGTYYCTIISKWLDDLEK
jgi:hypothetical protein